MNIWKSLEMFLYVRAAEEEYYQDLVDMGQDFIVGASCTVGNFLVLKW